MENIQKFLYGAIGLLVTLAVIGIGLAVYHQVTKMHSGVASNIDERQQEIDENEITRYAFRTIPGAVTTGYIQTIYDKVEEISIIKESTTQKISHNAASSYYIGETDLFRKLLDDTGSNPYYIDAAKQYKIEIERNPYTDYIDKVTVTEQP